MSMWRECNDLFFKLSKKAYNIYADSDFKVFQHLIKGLYRVAMHTEIDGFIFETNDISEIEDFFDTLYDNI